MSTAETTTNETSSSTRGPLGITALIGAVLLVVAVIFAASSSWYATFMAVHVSFVVIWIGGGAFLTIMALLAQRKNDSAELGVIARQAAFAGEKIFAPSGLIVVAMGIAMVLDGHLGFGHFWIIFGLLGFLSTFLTGLLVLGPMAKRLAKTQESLGPDAPESRAAMDRILLIARADIAVLLLVVVDMVTKPFS
jgi:uncharacterized membrane protein